LYSNKFIIDISIDKISILYKINCGEKMKYYIKFENGITFVYLMGKLQNDDYAQLQHEIIKQIAETDKPKVLLNMKNMDIIVSDGIAFLLLLSKKIDKLGGILKLAELSRAVKYAFEISDVDKIFKIYDSETSALELW